MAVAERIKETARKVIPPVEPAQSAMIPVEVKARLKRGSDRLKEVTPVRKEAIEFARGNNYSYLSEDGRTLSTLSTLSATLGGQKPSHRVRRSHKLIGPIVQAKVSAVTQRVPGYEVTATTTDPEDFTAAKLSEKVANAGYETWRVKQATEDLVWDALVTEEGFIMAYWEPNVGPYIEVDELDPETKEPTGKKEQIGYGEVRLWVGTGLEVTWEPGVIFEESRWWAIEHAREKDRLEEEEGFFGEALNSDAALTGDKIDEKKATGSNLVMVTEYLERPCPKWPRGRRIFIANGRVIFPEEDYPLEDPQGEVIDAPCIHRLTYTNDGASERGKGLVPMLVESMREYDNACNKAAEWMQVALVPQIIAPKGSIEGEITDEPGEIIEYDPTMADGQTPSFRQVPAIPSQIFDIRDRALAEMGSIAHVGEIPSNIRSGSGVNSVLEKEGLAWQNFLLNLAETHARVMRDCLTLVQVHYAEDRLVKFRGRAGYLPIPDFRGADIRGQTDVRVQPGSLEPITRPGIEARIKSIASMYPNYFPPEVVLSALEGGNAEGLIKGYEEDVTRANQVINMIRSGKFWEAESRPITPGEGGPSLDPATGEPEMGQDGQPVMLTELPGWMPRPFDNVPVHKATFEDFMKSDEWNYLDTETKKATLACYGALLDMEQRKAKRDAELQSQLAEQQGMANAAKGGSPKPLPSQPGDSAAPPAAEPQPA